MQTTEIIIKTGQPLSSEQAAFFATCFKPEEIEAVLKQGVKIRISLIAPWPKPKRTSAEPVIDPSLIDDLKSLIDHPDALETRIAELTGPQILKIGVMLGIPMSKQGTKEALRARLFGSLRSETVWRSISGQSVVTETPSADGPRTADADSLPRQVTDP